MISVPNLNRPMAQAIVRARETLPMFFSLSEAPEAGQGGFALKVAITDGRETEHFWLKVIRRDKNGFVGTIDNTPRSVKNVKFGQRYKFPHKDISDWMYVQGGKIFGGYTIRVLVGMMPAAEGARLKAMLAYQPE